MAKVTSLATAVLVAGVLSTGCDLIPVSGAETCVDWVWFETPQAQYDNASMVLIGNSVGVDGETSIYGYEATTHLIKVERVLKGDPGDGPLRISSTPQTFTGGESYPEGDPLQTDQRVMIFATQRDNEWFTMTPAQGVLPLPPGKEPPFR